jgi:hypothetical protein
MEQEKVTGYIMKKWPVTCSLVFDTTLGLKVTIRA